MDEHDRRRVRPLQRPAAAAVLLTLALAAGCDTIGADMDALAKGIMPPSPSQAAAWAFDRDPDRRREGTLLLSNAPFGGNPPYVEMYRDYVQNEVDPLVKAAAIRALGKHGAPEDAMVIAPHLRHESIQVRWEAAKSLQRLHNPRVVPDLLRSLGDEEESSDVRVAAAIALGQYPEDRVFQGLVAALEVRELAVNDAARTSLHTLTGESFDLDRRPWLAWYNAEADDPFAGRREFLYPTYHRKRSWLEQLAFWSQPVTEQPAPPAGLRPLSERRTYDDVDEADQNAAGGDQDG